MSGPMTIWWAIIGLAVTTALVKAAGPVVFGGRTPHPAFLRVVAMMAPALLAALVMAGIVVTQFREVQTDLEEAFMTVANSAAG